MLRRCWPYAAMLTRLAMAESRFRLVSSSLRLCQDDDGEPEPPRVSSADRERRMAEDIIQAHGLFFLFTLSKL